MKDKEKTIKHLLRLTIFWALVGSIFTNTAVRGAVTTFVFFVIEGIVFTTIKALAKRKA